MDYCGDITRHSHYIKSRTDLIRSYLDTAENRDASVCACIKHILGIKISDSCPSDIKEALNELQRLLELWDIMQDGDLAGFIYQKLESANGKKDKGQFFTPEGIVQYLVAASIPENTDVASLKILDPACGSGQFLIATFRHLASLYEKRGVPFHEAAYDIVTKNIYGSDIDSVSVTISKYNLSRLSGVPAENIINIFKLNFLATDNLFSAPQSPCRKFDIIIGNPPWGSNISADEKKYYRKIFESAGSGVNTFTLFMEQALNYLHDNGTLGFLIPEAYLNIKAHWNSRKLILQTTKIEELSRWGEQFKNVFAPSITIIAHKCDNTDQRNAHIIRIRDKQMMTEGTSQLVPQHYYNGTFQNIFNINYSHKAVSIISTINEHGKLYLENNARFFLGIVTGNNGEHLSLTQNNASPDPILIGRDVEQYKVNFSGHYFNYNPDALQQVAPQHFYTTKNKVLYKFIGRKLTFAIDYDGYYSLNNVNGFIPEIENCSPEYLTALLNSPVMQYYYDKNFFTLKVLRGNLEKLPLKLCGRTDMNTISDLSRTAGQTDSPQERMRCISQINDMFYSSYGIKDREAYRMIAEGQLELFPPSEGLIQSL